MTVATFQTLQLGWQRSDNWITLCGHTNRIQCTFQVNNSEAVKLSAGCTIDELVVNFPLNY